MINEDESTGPRQYTAGVFLLAVHSTLEVLGPEDAISHHDLPCDLVRQAIEILRSAAPHIEDLSL